MLLEFCHGQVHVYVPLNVGGCDSRLLKPLDVVSPDPSLSLHRLFRRALTEHAHRRLLFPIKRQQLRMRFTLMGENLGLILILIDFGLRKIRVELGVINLDRVDSLLDFRKIVVHRHLSVGMPITPPRKVHDFVIARVQIN